ncbi:MAG: hypothetical protein KBA66_14220 [Leptospiraceae bacterium]|nr:hypothetical protein [Leptospiraceae bacterium]
MMELEELISKTGDSELLELKYDCNKNLLEFTLELDVIDETFSFEVVTKEIRFGTIPERNRICYIQLLDISDKLATANGIYMPASDFGKLMQETRKGFNLVYGKRVTEVSHLLSLVGSDKLFIAAIQSKEAIKFFEAKTLMTK